MNLHVGQGASSSYIALRVRAFPTCGGSNGAHSKFHATKNRAKSLAWGLPGKDRANYLSLHVGQGVCVWDM